MMRQGRFWIEIVVVLIVAVAAFFIGRAFFPAESMPRDVSNNGVELSGDLEQSTTREEVPTDTVVPDQNSSVPANVAKPDTVIPAAPGVESKKRIFNISINSGKFVPDTVIVNVGDIANVTFTAVDQAYEIVQPDYGFKLNIAKGESKLLEAQFNTPGKYMFYCASCGGPEAGPKGYFTVVP